jgi:hypothetical protein
VPIIFSHSDILCQVRPWSEASSPSLLLMFLLQIWLSMVMKSWKLRLIMKSHNTYLLKIWGNHYVFMGLSSSNGANSAEVNFDCSIFINIVILTPQFFINGSSAFFYCSSGNLFSSSEHSLLDIVLFSTSIVFACIWKWEYCVVVALGFQCNWFVLNEDFFVMCSSF